jgi:hypothetical protein
MKNTAPIPLNIKRLLKYKFEDKISEFEVEIIFLGTDGERWYCDWKLPHVCEKGRVSGIDAFHALTLALTTIGNLIAAPGTPNLQIWWINPNDRGGF